MIISIVFMSIAAGFAFVRQSEDIRIVKEKLEDLTLELDHCGVSLPAYLVAKVDKLQERLDNLEIKRSITAVVFIVAIIVAIVASFSAIPA